MWQSRVLEKNILKFENQEYEKLRTILHFQKHDHLGIWFCQVVMFFVFAVFHFLCKFLILNETCQNDKIVNFSLRLDLSLDEHILRLWGSLWVARWLNWIQGHTEGGNPPLSWDPRLQGGLGAPRYVRKKNEKIKAKNHLSKLQCSKRTIQNWKYGDEGGGSRFDQMSHWAEAVSTALILEGLYAG